MTINQGQNTPKTFEDLLNSVPSVADGILSKANRLPDSDILVTKDGGDFKITVYKSGHYVYAEGKHTTVFAVDRCARYVDPVDLSRKLIPYDKIKDLDWYIPLMMYGMSRMEINRNRHYEAHEAFPDRQGNKYCRRNAYLYNRNNQIALRPTCAVRNGVAHYIRTYRRTYAPHTVKPTHMAAF